MEQLRCEACKLLTREDVKSTARTLARRWFFEIEKKVEDKEGNVGEYEGIK